MDLQSSKIILKKYLTGAQICTYLGENIGRLKYVLSLGCVKPETKNIWKLVHQ